MGLTLPIASVHAAQEDDPKKARPQTGDRLVFFSGDRKGDVITPDGLTLGGPQILAYPMDPADVVVVLGTFDSFRLPVIPAKERHPGG